MILMLVECFLLLVFRCSSIAARGYVSAKLAGQWGNQLFEIANGYAYALDNDISFLMPNLLHTDPESTRYGIPHNYARVYKYKGFNTSEFPFAAEFTYDQPSFNYAPIPVTERTRSMGTILSGYYQSENFLVDIGTK